MLPKSDRLESQWVTVNGLRLHVRVATGGGRAQEPPLVLVHGIGVSSRYMIPTADLLAEDFDVYAPDLPGFGKSARPPHVFSIREHADTLAAWMDAVGIERAAMLGNSFGCQIIAELAIRHPDRIVRAVWVGPTIDPKGRSFFVQIGRGLLDLPREPLSLMPILVYDYFAAGFYRMWRTYRYLLADPMEKKLPAVKVPTLIVRGAHDPIVPQDWAETAARLLPCGRVVVVPQGAHAVNYDAADDLRRVVRLFLRGGQGTDAGALADREARR